jgi:hypothetical protein
VGLGDEMSKSDGTIGGQQIAASDSDVIKWQLRFIKENAESLTESELTMCASFEDQFQKRGKLSERQMQILEEIYKRRT